MARPSYERLSAQDNSFLILEDPNTHMHVASINIFEAGPLRTADGGIDARLYKKAVESVLHMVPRYRQRLMWIPMENHAVWVDDQHFSLDFHLRHTALPHPGSDAQLKQLASRIMTQQLDRARPLWEIWVVEGLEGDRFATINKIHHCMLDGISGRDLAPILFSTKPEYEIHEAPRYVPHAPPSGVDLVRDSLLRQASLPFRIMRGVRDFRRETEDLRHEVLARVGVLADMAGATHAAPSTPMNGSLGPHRRFDWLSLPLAQFKAIGKAFECTVNDVVLATVTGAVRDFLILRRVHPKEIDFRVAAPVSVRREEERGRLGNRVSSWVVDLPVAEPNPRKRIKLLRQTTDHLKASRQALGIEMMMAVGEWTPTVLMSLGMRAASGMTNLVVSNVPGPQIPLYLLGSRLLEMYPVVPLLEHHGLAIALMSYAGTVYWGFNADYRLMPDLRKFVQFMDAAFTQLVEAAGQEPQRARPEPAQPEKIRTPPGNSKSERKRKRMAAAPAATRNGTAVD